MLMNEFTLFPHEFILFVTLMVLNLLIMAALYQLYRKLSTASMGELYIVKWKD